VQLLLCASGNDGARLAQTLQSLRAQHHDNWMLTIIADAAPPAGLALPERCEWLQCSTTEMIPQLNARIETSAADLLALLEAGDRLAPEALQHCVEYSVSHPDCRALYVDEDRIDAHGGRVDPRYKPDFNLELLRSYPYTGRFLLLRRDALLASGGYNHSAGLQAQELLFKITERHGAAAVGHVAELLYHRLEANDQCQDTALRCEQGTRLLTEHLQRLGVDAGVQAGLLPGSYFVDYRHAIQPVVSILIPTRDRLEVLKPCIESLLEKTAYPDFEVLVIDNGSRDKATLAYLDALRRNEPRVTVLDYPKKYNFAAINNFAAQHSGRCWNKDQAKTQQRQPKDHSLQESRNARRRQHRLCR